LHPQIPVAYIFTTTRWMAADKYPSWWELLVHAPFL
jgi:hypothetical protein